MYNANSTSQTYVVLIAHDDQSFGTDSDEAIRILAIIRATAARKRSTLALSRSFF